MLAENHDVKANSEDQFVRKWTGLWIHELDFCMGKPALYGIQTISTSSLGTICLI